MGRRGRDWGKGRREKEDNLEKRRGDRAGEERRGEKRRGERGEERRGEERREGERRGRKR